MAVVQLSEQVLLIVLSRESHCGNELDIAAGMAETKPSRHVIVDFSATQVLTSGMLSQLLVLERQLGASDKDLILCSVPLNIMRVFKCVGLQGLFRFAADRTAALESLGVASDSGAPPRV
ncbi:MAG TPA: STAS domain-containing protein [Sedimentisphaerales bacterium]|nr:STAS domain-containing protein [Sedimentisphaerales bacterium]HRS10213.1 STAS domain-containing protein [Sedimentisphaerales bacterium]HRV46919.1 STAS domain-containing protein [Sedimentisphaerales bacterium]